MERSRKMFLNTILLTATSFLMRAVGVAFQVYLSKRIGASGIGMFQLILSVSMLAATFAISGIRFAVTRLVSEELGKNNMAGVNAAMRRCLVYAAAFGTAALIILYFGAGFTGTKWLDDARTVLPIRLLALSLPAVSISSVLYGYFTAVSRVLKSSIVQILEQIIHIATVIAALAIVPDKSVEYACAAVVAGGVIGDITSCIILYIIYLLDRRRYNTNGSKPRGITKRMFGIALPLAFSAYARTSLASLQNLLIPRGLRLSGSTADKSLADYGMIQGMVFPIIVFPSALFYSLADLMVPELTQAQVAGRHNYISAMVNRILRLCLLFSIGVMGILFVFSGELGNAIYKLEEIGKDIRLLSFLMPFMYLDAITDGMLRGLGQHMYSMRYNIIDSFLSVILVYTLIPRYAVTGYIFILYFSELFNFTLSIRRLSKITKISFSLWDILKSLFCCASAISVCILLLRAAGLPLSAHPVSLISHIVISATIYYILLKIFGCIKSEDARWFKAMYK